MTPPATVSLLPFCEWLATTRGSIALHESLYAYPLVETLHVLSLMLFVGSIAFVDLRLLGRAFRALPVSQVTSRLLPFAIAGFALSAATGALLFYAIPVRTYLSVFFRVKVIMLALAGLNAWLFRRRMRQGPPAWDADPRPPLWVRVSGGVSLFAWATVIVMGRMIAYNWFDCDKPQSDLVRWAAGCP